MAHCYIFYILLLLFHPSNTNPKIICLVYSHHSLWLAIWYRPGDYRCDDSLSWSFLSRRWLSFHPPHFLYLRECWIWIRPSLRDSSYPCLLGWELMGQALQPRLWIHGTPNSPWPSGSSITDNIWSISRGGWAPCYGARCNPKDKFS